MSNKNTIDEYKFYEHAYKIAFSNDYNKIENFILKCTSKLINNYDEGVIELFYSHALNNSNVRIISLINLSVNVKLLSILFPPL